MRRALGALIPGVGMVVGTPRAHVFGGFHVGFAPPRVTSWVDSSGKNLDLAPERSLQYELGARVAPREWLKGEATGFLSNFENQIIPSTRAGGTNSRRVPAGERGVAVGVPMILTRGSVGAVLRSAVFLARR